MPDLEPGDITFSPDSSILAVCRNTSRSGNDPRAIRMFLTDPATGLEIGQLSFGTHLIYLEFARDGRRLIYSIAGPVRLYDYDWKTGAGGPVYPDLDPSLAPFTIDYCERTRTVACTLYSGGGCVFQADSPNPVVRFPGHIPEFCRVELAPDGQTAAVFDGRPLECFRAPSGERLPVPATGPVERVRFSPDGRYLAYTTREAAGRVHFLDPRTGQFAASFACANDALDGLAFSPDGSVLATGTNDGSILLWRLRRAKPLRFQYASEKEAAASDYYVRDRDDSRAVPAAARVTLKTAKPRYLLGEEIFVQFELSNAGRRPFTFTTGGDYRGATRHLSYQVDAIHADGEAMPDPHPNQMCFGGLSGGHRLVPGANYTESLRPARLPAARTPRPVPYSGVTRVDPGRRDDHRGRRADPGGGPGPGRAGRGGGSEGKGGQPECDRDIGLAPAHPPGLPAAPVRAGPGRVSWGGRGPRPDARPRGHAGPDRAARPAGPGVRGRRGTGPVLPATRSGVGGQAPPPDLF